MRIIPENDLYPHLTAIHTPGRYVGGEFGANVRDEASSLKVAISFPDMYEIGMSNLAVRILYNRLNACAGVQCERVFAPAADFEELLRTLSIPLYTLENGIPLHELDVLGFSIGYELVATNILTILDLGGIPLRSEARTEADPIIIAGGPSITNPAPLEAFIDAFLIGESDEVVSTLFTKLAVLKSHGAGREDLLARVFEEPSCYGRARTGKTVRSVFQGWSEESAVPHFPVPSIRTIQDNGVVEIMRGCPNGCRFCHAGIFYRPFRMKSSERVEQEVDALVRACGYREISLSSLSSGDYTGIIDLVRRLNARYQEERISFALPSMRINSFTFPLLEEIASIRKSGLTFAVETPIPSWQLGLNKEIDLERTVQILTRAKRSGWKQAKFYFMIGLPVAQGADETGPIADFLNEVQRLTGMNINANVGTFIPKPHTPFQWARQFDEQESLEAINAIKHNLSSRKIKLGYHAPFLSVLEGIVSRGDARTGDLIQAAWEKGARFDAWEDLVRKGIWRSVIEEAAWEVEASVLAEKSVTDDLPWDSIETGVSKEFLKEEYVHSVEGRLTSACEYPCVHNCGVCNGDTRPVECDEFRTPTEPTTDPTPPVKPATPPQSAVDGGERMLFSFTKAGKAVFLSHLNVMSVFERALLRAGIHARFTEGFNPKPRLEFAQPISLGLSSDAEIAAVELAGEISTSDFMGKLNASLPEGLSMQRAAVMKKQAEGRKKLSLMALYGGSDYLVSGGGTDRLAFETVVSRLRAVPTVLQVLSVDTGSGILLRIAQGKGIGGLLKEIFPEASPVDEGFRIGRLHTWCKRAEGIGDYFDELCEAVGV